jgi:hypothetical protein
MEIDKDMDMDIDKEIDMVMDINMIWMDTQFRLPITACGKQTEVP